MRGGCADVSVGVAWILRITFIFKKSCQLITHKNIKWFLTDCDGLIYEKKIHKVFSGSETREARKRHGKDERGEREKKAL